MRRCRAIVIVCGIWLLAGGGLVGGAEQGTAAKVGYNRDVRPILADRCFRCHGFDAAQRQAELRLDRRDDALAPHDSGRPIVPGKPDESEVYRRLIAADVAERMPPVEANLPLSADEIATIRRWIEQGAEYEPHWAFTPITAPPLPKVVNQNWIRNPIDSFVLAELEEHKLKSAAEATKAALLRRVTLDLTGLPPTIAELDAFLVDDSPAAYERVVDRLLASPRLGERLAVDWLDGARYADTNGYYTDNERQAWPWRDWVIRAFNENRPFDQFTIEQLAGDLLPDATLDQRIATGFNRNHMVTNESGSIDEEFRASYVMDRTDTTAAVWLGLTFGCARCHDHKYDPISQEEYYRLFAYFNSVPEKGLVKETTSPLPVVSLPTAEQERQIAALEAELKTSEAKLRANAKDLDQALAAWESTVLKKLPQRTTVGVRAALDFEVGEDENEQPIIERIGTLKTKDGIRGQAGDFDATQYLEFDDLPLERTTPFSLSVWIKPGTAPQGCVVSKMASTGDRGFEIMWYKSQPRINLVHQWGRSAIEVVSQGKFTSAQWRHLAVSYDGSSRAAGVKVYVDGKLQPLSIRRDTLADTIATDEPWRVAWKGTGIGFEGGLDEFRLYDRELTSAEVDAIYWRDLLEGAVAVDADKRTRQQKDGLRSRYLADEGTPEQRAAWQTVTDVKAELATVRSAVVTASVMEEMPEPRQAHVLIRGQYDQPGKAVTPGVPKALGSLPADAPNNRLGLAQWIVGPTNPLTARVVVNRYWQLVFGEGLVRTSNDFGLQGEQPTHAELLDYLAVRLRESGWNIKALLKLMVTSAAYRQSSAFTPELATLDPENRLLARSSRHRLSAEALRDQALAVSGLLSPTIGGPSVKSYQPPGLWEAVSYNGDQSYVPDHGEGLYRRSLYSYWKRQSPPPGILTFDGPTREVCQLRRPRTNTPLQALLLLNDTTYAEAARKLAERIVREAGADGERRLEFGFRLVTGRLPKPTETAALRKLYDAEFAALGKNPATIKERLSVGESEVDKSLDPRELAAWTAVAGVLLNLDETVTRP